MGGGNVVVTWKVVEGCVWQNSHSRNLPTSFLGRWVNSWYVEHKVYVDNKAFVVHLVERSTLCCGCALHPNSSVQFRDCALFLLCYNNNNCDNPKFLLDSLYSEIPTGLLLDSYWNPCTGLHYTHSLGIRNSL